MKMTRRSFLAGMTAGGAGMALGSGGVWAADPSIRLGACDWSLGLDAPAALEAAKRIGLDGIEASAGGPVPGGDALTISDPDFRKKCKEAALAHGLPIASVALGLMNNFPLATDPRGASWLDQAVTAAQDLGARVVLIAFFGKGDLLRDNQLKRQEADAAIGKIKDAAPRAKEAGVILGLENMLSAEQNLWMLEQIKHDRIGVYYDVGNSTDAGNDVGAEIRRLGDRICQIHFKDGNRYLGEGKVNMAAAAESMRAINYKGWVMLETSMPSKNRDADFKRNAEFARNLLKI